MPGKHDYAPFEAEFGKAVRGSMQHYFSSIALYTFSRTKTMRDMLLAIRSMLLVLTLLLLMTSSALFFSFPWGVSGAILGQPMQPLLDPELHGWLHTSVV